jgi:hypothetical protein
MTVSVSRLQSEWASIERILGEGIEVTESEKAQLWVLAERMAEMARKLKIAVSGEDSTKGSRRRTM